MKIEGSSLDKSCHILNKCNARKMLKSNSQENYATHVTLRATHVDGAHNEDKFESRLGNLIQKENIL